jgi:hypothetical protein
MIYRRSLHHRLASAVVASIVLSTCAYADDYRPNAQPMFGTYSQAYLDRQQAKRWKELCKGGGRYQAMSEAYEAGKPDPCKR